MDLRHLKYIIDDKDLDEVLLISGEIAGFFGGTLMKAIQASAKGEQQSLDRFAELVGKLGLHELAFRVLALRRGN